MCEDTPESYKAFKLRQKLISEMSGLKSSEKVRILVRNCREIICVKIEQYMSKDETSIVLHYLFDFSHMRAISNTKILINLWKFMSTNPCLGIRSFFVNPDLFTLSPLEQKIRRSMITHNVKPNITIPRESVENAYNNLKKHGDYISLSETDDYFFETCQVPYIHRNRSEFAKRTEIRRKQKSFNYYAYNYAKIEHNEALYHPICLPGEIVCYLKKDKATIYNTTVFENYKKILLELQKVLMEKREKWMIIYNTVVFEENLRSAKN
jgi:hypothetical protein